MNGVTIWHYYGNDRAYCSQKVAISDTGEFSGEETVVMDTGTCSGWCTYPITCTNAEAGDCTPDNYGPTETADGNQFTWEPVVGRYVRHYASRGQNAGVHFMEISVYGCEGTRVIEGGDTGLLGLSAWTPDMTMPRVDPGGWELKDMQYTAPRNTIALDGDLADWDCTEYFSQTPFVPSGTVGADADLVIFDEYAGGVWNGPADHSMAVAFNWDPDNLYIGLKVIDDTHQLEGLSGWNGDSVQVVFADAARETVTHLYNYAIGVEMGADNIVAHHESGPGGTEAVVSRFEASANFMAFTTYELKFPAAIWGIAAGEAGLQLGIGICANDGDTEAGQGGQKGWSGWGPYAAVYGKTASATGIVTLGAEPPATCSRSDDATAIGQSASTLGDWLPTPIVRVGASPDGIFDQNDPRVSSTPCKGVNPCASLVYTAGNLDITMDGDLGDWDVPASQVMGQTAFLPYNSVNTAGTLCCGGSTGCDGGGCLTVFDEYAGGIWNGIDDHSAAFTITWTPDNLFIGIKVIDDLHQLNGQSGWNGDSVQVVFADDGLSTITHLYNYAIAQENDNTVTHHQSGPSNTEAAITRYEPGRGAAAAQGLTIYELRFPAATWELDNFASGQCAGVGLTMNDGDTEDGQGGQKGWSGWAPYSCVYGKNPEECGVVCLGA
jgi:hypothetical protein